MMFLLNYLWDISQTSSNVVVVDETLKNCCFWCTFNRDHNFTNFQSEERKKKFKKGQNSRKVGIKKQVSYLNMFLIIIKFKKWALHQFSMNSLMGKTQKNALWIVATLLLQ